MRVLLREKASGRYYAKGKNWVSDSARAQDFKLVRCANQLAAHRHLDAVEIVLDYGQPLGNLIMPLWERL